MAEALSIDISVRRQSIGGGVAPRLQLNGERRLRSAKRIIVLIHGFNVPLCGACDSYDYFSSASTYTPGHDQARFFWPGDAHVPFLSSPMAGKIRSATRYVISGATYPYQIGDAEKSAERLSEFLARNAIGNVGRREFTFVAHSLGCRVTLEALTRLSRAGFAPKIGMIALMAAAVPRYMVTMGGRLHHGYLLARRRVSFYSRDDSTVGSTFSLGQIFESVRDRARAFSGSQSSQAIGYVGFPKTAGARNIHVEGATHGDYWPNIEVARRIRSELAEMDGRARPRQSPTREGLARRSAPARPIGVRNLTERTVGTRRGMCRQCP